MSPQIRFRPPPLEMTAELHWVLVRAFAAPGAEVGGTIDSARALELADLLRLAPRIWPRHVSEDLEDEIGSAATESLHQRFAETVARGAVRIEALEIVLETAAALETPVAALKHEGLRLGGHIREGSRSAGDIDILVPEDRAQALHAFLERQGFERVAAPGPEHHLQTLVHPKWGMTEVHTKLPGVRQQASESVRFDDLAEAGKLATLPGGPPHLFVPQAEVLAAHALTHGLVQHGHQPASYPMMRLFADLIDLGMGLEEDEDLVKEIELLAVPAISMDELRAARALCAGLRTGLPSPPEESLEPGADLLLRHALAGRLNETYEESLRLAVFTRGMSDQSQWQVASERVWQSAFPNRQAMDSLYGPPGSKVGSVAQRVRHLGRLTGRLAGAVRARFRLRAGG